MIFGIDEIGDLYWLKHDSWPTPAKKMEGPVKIGNGWNIFSRVFAFGSGFIAGVYPSGEMLLTTSSSGAGDRGTKAPSGTVPCAFPARRLARLPGAHPDGGGRTAADSLVGDSRVAVEAHRVGAGGDRRERPGESEAQQPHGGAVGELAARTAERRC